MLPVTEECVVKQVANQTQSAPGAAPLIIPRQLAVAVWSESQFQPALRNLPRRSARLDFNFTVDLLRKASLGVGYTT